MFPWGENHKKKKRPRIHPGNLFGDGEKIEVPKKKRAARGNQERQQRGRTDKSGSLESLMTKRRRKALGVFLCRGIRGGKRVQKTRISMRDDSAGKASSSSIGLERSRREKGKRFPNPEKG